MLVVIIIIAFVSVIIANHHKIVIPKMPALVVKTKPLALQKLPVTTLTYGTTTSPSSVDLRAQVDAVITAIDFKPGQTVKKGQRLFSLQASDVDNSPVKLKAAMIKSRDTYYRLLSEYKAYPGGLSRHALVQARLTYSENLAAYRQALLVQTVRAPVSGVISDTRWAVGDFVPSNTLLASLIKPNSVQIEYELPSRFANEIKLGQVVNFTLAHDLKSYQAHVSYISPMMNQSNYNIMLRANFTKPNTLRPNQFGKVQQILDSDHPTLAISQAVVETDSAGYYVYTVENNKIAKQYFVPSDITNAGLVVIQSGLKEGLPIVMTNLSELSPGQVVKVDHE